MESSAAKRPTSPGRARLVAVALHAALALLLALATPVMAGDPGNGNGNGNGNANGPDRTEAPGNGNDRKPTPEPATPAPTFAPTPEPTPLAAPPAAAPPSMVTAPPAPAGPSSPPAATVVAPATRAPARATTTPAAGVTSGLPRPTATPSDGTRPRRDAPQPAGALAARDGHPSGSTPGELNAGFGSDGAPVAPANEAPVVPALMLLAAFASTAGGLVFVGRRRDAPAAEPDVVPVGMSPLPDLVPASDPLLAALQGSTRFAPPDGTTTAAQAGTVGDGGPLWVRRLEPRIPVMPSLARAESPRVERNPGLEDAFGS